MEKKEKVTSFLHKQDNGDKPSRRIMLQRSNMKWVQLLGYLIMECVYFSTILKLIIYYFSTCLLIKNYLNLKFI
jgi:hypothetical protein